VVKFCSVKCANENKKGIVPNNALETYYETHSPKLENLKPGWNKGLTGEKSHMWKGGLVSQNKLERRKFCLTIQKQVLERDNHTCQICGSEENLQVDHIQSWKDYVELRFSMDNCRTLCTKCHYKITFGKEMPKTVKSWGYNLLRTT
jgi:hypothetical protein